MFWNTSPSIDRVIGDYKRLLLGHTSSEDNWRIEQELSSVDSIKNEKELLELIKPIYHEYKQHFNGFRANI
jgi:hypothetical protein